MRTNERCCGLQPPERMLQVSVPDCRSSDYERAVGNRVRDRFIFFGAGQHIRGAYCGARTLKGHIVRIYDPQMLKSKVAHRTSGCADVERIAGVHQDHAQVIEFRRRGQAIFILRHVLLSFVQLT